MKNQNPRTKYFNVVTNAQHGACLLFDRKGKGVSQSQTHRRSRQIINHSFISDAFDKTFLVLRAQLKNIMPGQKRVPSLRT